MEQSDTTNCQTLSYWANRKRLDSRDSPRMAVQFLADVHALCVVLGYSLPGVSRDREFFIDMIWGSRLFVFGL